MRITFAGLGVMGGPMAGHLVRAGHTVTGFNRSVEKTTNWAARTGGIAAGDLGAAVSDCEALLLCVGRDEDVRQTVEGALPFMTSGSLIVDHTTISPALTREMYEKAKAFGVSFYDAPVSGGQAGAENGQLAIMVGGAADRFDEVVEICAPYTRSITRIGEAGAGQTAKMANQIAIAGVVQGLAEALHFTRSAGLDAEAVFQAISGGAAGSWQMNNRWASMNEGRYDFGFAVDWMRKDLGIALEEARRNGAHLPVTALVDQFYSEIQAMGGRRWDTSSLHKRLEDRRS